MSPIAAWSYFPTCSKSEGSSWILKSTLCDIYLANPHLHDFDFLSSVSISRRFRKLFRRKGLKLLKLGRDEQSSRTCQLKISFREVVSRLEEVVEENERYMQRLNGMIFTSLLNLNSYEMCIIQSIRIALIIQVMLFCFFSIYRGSIL